MTDVDIDALGEAARNRGLKLVRSRVRTPGKRRFGKAGLTDGAGTPVFGMDAKGPTAKPEDVAEFLRKLGAQDWGASLGEPLPPLTKAKPQAKPRPVQKAATMPRPKPQPRLQLRDARPGDAAALVDLISLLGAKVDEPGVRRRVAALVKDGLPPIVAVLGKQLVGVCALSRMLTIHRDRPVGRINMLVVAEDKRGQGLGRMLTEAAEAQLRKCGCGLLEVTSNDSLAAAHAFYRHLGFERTSIRFAKPL